MTNEFEQTWQALVENGTSKRNKDATKRFWDTLTPAQQHQAYVRITQRAHEGGFLQYDPIRAIKENIRRLQVVGPTNYNWRTLPNEPTETAFYNGKWGVYTLEDIKKFNLLTKKHV